MGRKSLVAERTSQIIDAFETCILQYGLAGASLQRTAETAGLNLGMIHHYIGRRNDLIQAMVKRLIARQTEGITALMDGVPQGSQIYTLLDAFFMDETDNDVLLLEALLTEADRDPFLEEMLKEINTLYLEIWTNSLQQHHPHQTVDRCQEIAVSILSLAYGESLVVSTMNDANRQRAIYRAAEILIANP